MNNKIYRHEFKYLISEAMMAQLRQRIENLIPLDSHVQATGKYCIRSLYFDDYADRCFHEVEEGTDPREKFRIRIYNCSDAKINLECKRKENDKTLKSTCQLTREQTEALIAGHIPSDYLQLHPVLRKLCLLILQTGMHPAVIVEYERIPFVYSLGNVRVTFDTQIVSSSDFSHFFSPDIPRRGVLPAGMHLMEVKYDEFLPSYIFDSLQLRDLQRTSFSKYYLCRKYKI